MQTLDQLISGQLKGISTLKLSCGLKEFPPQIADLADTLEMLDLSGNQLSELPVYFGCFKKLKIAFFSDNEFEVFPQVLAQCPELEMIGFRSNKIKYIFENSFPKKLRWLTLTNNKIEALPIDIGNCLALQKVALAGNNITELPKEMAACINLELLRISANKIKELPNWLISLPKLSWLAYAGNDFNSLDINNIDLNEMQWNDFVIEQKIGEGASGKIYKVKCLEQSSTSSFSEYALKEFKGEITSDGSPLDEMKACILAGKHTNLVNLVARLKDHPENKQGLVFNLLNPNYSNLGNPPSFITCSRDTFPDNLRFSFHQFYHIAKQIASVSNHLHQKGIMHGDLYAHNILVDNDKALLSDFGAATIYDKADNHSPYLERIDVRAYGCLLEDLLLRTLWDDVTNQTKDDCFQLKENCMQSEVLKRPNFFSIGCFFDELNYSNGSL